MSQSVWLIAGIAVSVVTVTGVTLYVFREDIWGDECVAADECDEDAGDVCCVEDDADDADSDDGDDSDDSDDSDGGNGGGGGGGGGSDSDEENACDADGVTCTTADFSYFGSTVYQAKTASEKLDDLWTETTADATVEPQNWSMDDLFARNMNVSFDRESDELPENRPKINHSQGVVCKVEWVDQGGHNYTGLYNGGSSTALMRMSESNFIFPEAGGLAPSLAIKFLIDGDRSRNLLANVGFESTSSWNFFSANFRARVDLHEDQCAADTIERKFLNALNTP